MIKRYLFSADWRKEDVEFLKSLKINRKIDVGFFGFNVDQETHNVIMENYSNNTPLTKPKSFNVQFTGVTFSKKELDNASFYNLIGTGFPVGNGLPKNYKKQIFSYDNEDYKVNRTQIGLFRIKKPKWTNKRKNFTLHSEWDKMFFKKDFYQEVLAPLGLNYLDVINHSTGEVLSDTIQLEIPLAQSNLKINNTLYDLYSTETPCGKKQYSQQHLDFFPNFENLFEFHICYSREEFLGGYKRIIISKDFCKILLDNNVIEYDSNHLIPFDNS